MTVTDDDGGSVSDTTTVNVSNVNPAVSIVGAPSSSPEGAELHLTAGIVDVGSHDTHTCLWSVTKNGEPYASGSGISFNFTPDDDATYVVNLSVNDDDGGIATASAIISVTNVHPSVVLEGQGEIDESSTYSLTVHDAADIGADHVFQYVVFWGDGTSDSYTTTGVKTHFYGDSAAVTGPISVTLLDEDGSHPNAGVLARTVKNVAPTATLLNGGAVNEGQTGLVLVTAQNDVSAADRAAGYTYGYDFNNDGDFLDEGEIASTLLASATVPAGYLDNDPEKTVRVEIRDKDGAARSYTTTITVLNVAPTIEAGADASTFTGSCFTRAGTIADPGNDDWTVTANFGDSAVYEPVDVSGHNFNLSHTFDTPGTYSVTVRVSDGGGVVTDNFQVHVISDTLRIVSFAANASGFDVQFNRDIDWEDINLYDGSDASIDLPDIVVLRDGRQVNGSLDWDSANRTMTFVKTGGVLDAGSYSVTLRSETDAFNDAGGLLLDGNSDGLAGDAAVRTFTVSAEASRVVSIPDFARMADQTVNVPATASGLPVRISDASGVLSMDFAILYDPALLNISGISLGSAPAAAGSWHITTNLSTPGIARVTIWGENALAGSDAELVKIDAVVPTEAPYRSSEVIRISELQVNEGAIPAKADYAFHKVAIVGDASGNRFLGGVDASAISNLVVHNYSGFDAYATTDPVVIADITGNGELSGQDVAYVARKAAHLIQPEIPDIPVDLSPLTVSGPDPIIALPTDLAGQRGEAVNTAVTISDATDLLAADLVLTYDTAMLDLSNSDVSLGSLLSGGSWDYVVNVDDANGVVYVTMWTDSPMTGGSGEVLNLAVHVADDAPAGQATLEIGGWLNEGALLMTASNGALTVPVGVDIHGPSGAVVEGSSVTLSAGLVGQQGSVTYEWNVSRDGATYCSGTDSTLTFTPDDDALYIATLVVTDTSGNTGMDTFDLNIANVDPAISIVTSTSPVDEGSLASVTVTADDAAGLSDPLMYEFDFDNDGIYEVGPQSSNAASHTFADNGDYTVNVRVTDGDNGTATSSTVITVNNVDPAPAITNLPAGNTVPEYTPITLGVSENDPGSDTFAYAWVIDKDGAPFMSGSESTIAFVPERGHYTISVTVTDDDGGSHTATQELDVTHVTFRVTSLVGNPSGFDVRFNRPASMLGINLYDGIDAATDLPDLVVTNSSGTVIKGSLVWNTETRTASWIATNGVLPAGNYNVTLAGRSDAWRDVRDGEVLDGDFDGAAGGDYAGTFTVDPIGSKVITLPDFARGPGQPVNVPAIGTGLPITINDGAGVSRLHLVLIYNPAMLTISAASLASGVPSGWTLDADLSMPGRVTIDASGSALPAGKLDIVRLTADVPSSVQYGAAEILRIEDLSVYADQVMLTATADRSLHKAAFVGDASGNRVYSGSDASYIARVNVHLDTGFDAFPLTDPVIIGDVHVNGVLSGTDASYVAQKSVHLPRPEIPDLPAGNTPIIPNPGMDPIVSFPTVTAVPGQVVHAPLTIEGATGLLSVSLALDYNTNILDLNVANVTLTGLAASGWAIAANVDEVAGRLFVEAWSSSAVDGSGPVLDIAFTVPDNVAGSSWLIVDCQLNDGALPVTPVNGRISVQPASMLIGPNPAAVKMKSVYGPSYLVAPQALTCPAVDSLWRMSSPLGHIGLPRQPGTGLSSLWSDSVNGRAKHVTKQLWTVSSTRTGQPSSKAGLNDDMDLLRSLEPIWLT